MKNYIKPITEIIVSESVVMDTDSHGWTSGEQALAKPNDMFFDWDDNDFGDTWNNDEDTEPIN